MNPQPKDWEKRGLIGVEMNENMAMLGRRSFLMGMGVMGAGIVGMSTAGCSPKPKEEEHASGDAANALFKSSPFVIALCS